MHVEAEPGERLVASLRPKLMRRALRNLVDDAVKYGGLARVRLRRDGAAALVEIDDDGPGIPEADQERATEEFVWLEASRNRRTGGSRLGLATARAVVREHGGELRLSNRPGGGLRATVRLPSG